jgi:hypothetical protein
MIQEFAALDLYTGCNKTESAVLGLNYILNAASKVTVNGETKNNFGQAWHILRLLFRRFDCWL